MRLTDAQWIFFDMGSTLIDETASYLGWFRAAATHTHGALTAEDIEREYCAGMARYAPTVSKQLEPFGFRGNSTRLYPSELDSPYPQAERVLSALSCRYKLGIIANQNPGAHERLEKYGLRKHFKFVVASAEVGFAKPDERIFRLALNLADCAPEHAVMVGDRPDNDIFPAKRLGMRTVRVMQGYARFQPPRIREHEADMTVESIEALPALFLPAE